MTYISNQTFDGERALYGSRDLVISDCTFDGPVDGESALKESFHITVQNSFFNLRYPFWHDHELKITGCELTDLCRAALWYSSDIAINDTKLHGIKALRECNDVRISGSDILSSEFGWSTRRILVEDTNAVSEYFMMRSEDLIFRNVTLQGRYSFQYTKNAVFENCTFETKDAFWHGENITVRNSVIKGEYLAWYSNGLTLENCKIIGTQPFCYCTNLKLLHCEMIGCDLAFEKSEVEAAVTTPVASIKNPKSGTIKVPAVGEMIRDDPQSHGQVLVSFCQSCKVSA